jgi:hypothetical protein
MKEETTSRKCEFCRETYTDDINQEWTRICDPKHGYLDGAFVCERCYDEL